MLGHVVVVGVVEEGLGWNTADIETGPAQGRALLHTNRLHPAPRVKHTRKNLSLLFNVLLQ